MSLICYIYILQNYEGKDWEVTQTPVNFNVYVKCPNQPAKERKRGPHFSLGNQSDSDP